MQVTRAGDYAFRALAYMANTPNHTDTARIAREVGVPPVYLRKIFQSLSRAGIVRTFPGTGGGVALARPPSAISLREVIEALEGPIILSECIARPEACSRSSDCKIRQSLAALQDSITGAFASRTIADIL